MGRAHELVDRKCAAEIETCPCGGLVGCELLRCERPRAGTGYGPDP